MSDSPTSVRDGDGKQHAQHEHGGVVDGHVVVGERGRLASAISNTIVRLFAEYLGRGPTKARAIVTGAAIMVILEETLTKAERKLIESGLGESVRSVRRQLQDTMRDEMVASIEDLTGRRVIGFLSDHQLDPDIAVETFVLERQPATSHEESPAAS
jgi:uncharacterized protein YbcI